MRRRHGWLAASVGVFTLSVAGAKTVATSRPGRARIQSAAPQAWRGRDNYQVIMWSTGKVDDLPRWVARLRELGCTAAACDSADEAARLVRNQFGFYAENLVPELAFLNNRAPLYDEDYKGYTATHDKRYLVRRPCFDDPAFWEKVPLRVQTQVRSFAPYHPLLYDLRDEASLGRFVNPMDYCFGPYTLRAFRRWLQAQYPTLAALNQEWGTTFRSWGAVIPLTTYEVKARERAALRAGQPENDAPWADHRAYMDFSFARTLARLRSDARKVDATTPVGIEGAQMPSAWGGCDLWRLSQAVDWLEPYDVANSRVILRSFLRPAAPVFSTVFGSDLPRIRRRLWWLLLQGDHGCIIWDDEQSRCVEKTKAGLPLTARGRGLAPLFAELKAVAPRLFPLERRDDRIAIHYSAASIRAHWMFDSREDGDTWPRRLSSYEATHSRLARVRDSFLRVIEDLGLQPSFVASEPIENGRLMADGYRVLLLPQSVAMSAKECRQVEAFARAGGTVIADNMTATMDEHCRRLPAGQLDPLFGIHRSRAGWRPSAAAGELPVTTLGSAPLQVFEPEITVTTGQARYRTAHAPAVIEHRFGAGRAIYLNLDMHGYGQQRLRPPWAGDTRELFRRLLAQSGVRPSVRVVVAADGRPVPGVEIWRYRGGGRQVVALMRNPEFEEGLRAVGYPDNTALEQPVRVQVLLPQTVAITDLRTGRALGVSDRVSVALDPWSPTILALDSRQSGAHPYR
jgi:hypothetical protein